MIWCLNFMLRRIHCLPFLTKVLFCPGSCNQSLEIYLGTKRLILTKFIKFLFFFCLLSISYHPWDLTPSFYSDGNLYLNIYLENILWKSCSLSTCGKRAFLEQKSHTGTSLDVLTYSASILGCYWICPSPIPRLLPFFQTRFNCKRPNSSVIILF